MKSCQLEVESCIANIKECVAKEKEEWLRGMTAQKVRNNIFLLMHIAFTTHNLGRKCFSLAENI